jgi:hypothetical protein
VSDFYRENFVKKTRKEHQCLGCVEKIPAGSEAIYIAAVFEGYFGAYHMCKECMEYIDRHPFERGDFWCGGDIGDARREEKRESEVTP